MAEPLLDVKDSLRLIRRRWIWLAVMCVLGAGLAGGFVVASAPADQASALVLLAASSGSGSGTSSGSLATITTDARIAESGAVLGPAGKKLNPPQSITQLQGRISAVPTSSGVLKITASADSAAEAKQLANAVADELVVFITTSGSSAISGAVSALESQKALVSKQITNVKAELANAKMQLASDGSTSPTGVQDQGLISKLTSAQANLNLQLDSLKSQISQAQLEQSTTNQGTEVIQRASTQAGLTPTTVALPVVLGIIGGLLVGFVLAVVASRRDRRLRTRDAISEAVGAPVILSLEEHSPRSTKDWTDLLERHSLSAPMEWHVRRGLRELGIGAGSWSAGHALRILAFSDDDAAAAGAVEIAVAVAESGTRTLFWMGGSPEDQVTLRAVLSNYESETRKPRPTLTVSGDLPTSPEEASTLEVELATLDRADPQSDSRWRRQDVVLLAVSAGRATGEDLARAAINVDSAGLRIGGVVVVNPASEDETVGRFPDAGVRRTVLAHQSSTGLSVRASRPR